MIYKTALIVILILFNFAILADVKDDIKKINELNESGILSEKDYANLLEKSISQTEEYKKIKGLFDSEIISLEEFENFKNKIITKYIIGNIFDETPSNTDKAEAAKEAADKAEALAAKEAADKAEALAAKEAADKAEAAKEAADKAEALAAKEAADKAEAAKEAADKAEALAQAAKEAADKAQAEAEAANNNIDVVRKQIGKVLKIKKGKGFGDGIKLRKKDVIETGVLYSTLAGGDLHLMLDSKTRIFIGYESEIIINKFDVVDNKVHEVEIELISGSFLYLSLRKTSTDLKIIIDNNIATSKGLETSVAFIKKEEEIRLVNAGKSTLKFKDELLNFSQYAILDPISKSLNINAIPNAGGDKLIGTALDDFSMTVMGVPAAGSDSEDNGGSGGSGGGGGGCG